MREILTVLAGLLALVLTIAFVGPYAVDWTAHRDWVEAQLSDAVGARVAVEGRIDITLLPTPRLSIVRVRIGGATPGAPDVTAASMRLELSPSPLMRGELRLTDADIEAPNVRFTLGPDGALALPDLGGSPTDRIVIDRLKVHGGSITVDDPARARSLLVRGIELEAEAASLIGPFKGAGQFGEADAATVFRFTTGAREADRMRLKLIVDETPRSPRMDIDGAVSFAAAAMGSTSVTYAGPATFSGRLRGVPWRATGVLSAGPSSADLKSLELRAGPEDKALNVAGAAHVAFGANPQIGLDLAARQIDLDRLFGEDGSAAQHFGDAVAGFIDASDVHAPLPFSVNLTSPALTLGGDTLSDVSTHLSLRAGELAVVRFDANGPGRSRILLDGNVETGLAAKFSGKVDASIRDMARFEDWLANVSAELSGRLRNLPMRSLDIAGVIDLSRAGFVGRNLAIKADRSSFSGAMAYTRAVGDERARLFADLNSPALDLDGVPDMTGPASAAIGIDMSLSLDARAVRLARFGEGMIDAGRINIRLAKTGEDLRLENFAIANLGGAALNATGSLGPTGAQLDARLDATRLVDLADLVKRIAPGAAADALASRAVALSPARFNLKFAAPRGATDSLLHLGTLTLDASARGTTIKGSAKPDTANPAILQASATIEAPEAASLLRQLGLDTIPLGAAGRGRVTFTASGDPARGIDSKVEASLAGTDISYVGRIGSISAEGEMAGDVKLRSSNLAPLLQIISVSAPDPTGPSLPAELSAQVAKRGETWAFAHIGGRAGTTNISGDLALSPKPSESRTGRRLTGALQFDRLSFAGLAALAFGPQVAPRSGAIWSDARFAPALAAPPDTEIELSIKRFDLATDLAAADASMRLGLSPGVVTMSGVRMSIFDGVAGGAMVLRRDGGAGALSAHVQLDGVAVNRPSLAARATGAFDVTATGASAAALVAGLAGGGSLSVSGMRVPAADPDAVDRVVALAEQDAIVAAEPEVRSALGLEFAKAPVALGDRSFDVNIASGAMRLTPAAGAPSDVALSLDFKTLSSEQKVSLVARHPPRDWIGAPPQASVIWKGPIGSLVRSIDAASLGNALSTRAIARETARMQAFEADIRERAFFNRRVKALQYMRQREREIAVYEAEQARLAAEEEKRRAAESARLEREQRIRDLTEAARVEREKRAVETIPQRQQADVGPRPIAPPPALLAPGAIDPSAAGRY